MSEDYNCKSCSFLLRPIRKKKLIYPPCKPCKQTKIPKLDKSALFTDIGLPEDTLGQPPFHDDTPCPTKEFIKETDKYEEDAEVWFVKPPPVQLLTQYTPSYTRTSSPSGAEMINTQTALSQARPDVNSQDPDGFTSIPAQDWADSTWDGTPLDPTGLTPTQLCDFIRPVNSLVIRGLRERFYEVNPFADNTNPTVAEIDNWNLEVIRHFRSLFGNTTPVSNDPRLFLEARWASERKRTQDWDVDYPSTGTYGGPGGPCFDASNNPVDTAGGHCGASFWPDVDDRGIYISAEPYNSDFSKYPELAPETYTLRRAQAEGVAGTSRDVPWSIKLAVVIANWVCSEGLTGHSGPYFGREYFGSDWWDTGTSVAYRGKWR